VKREGAGERRNELNRSRNVRTARRGDAGAPPDAARAKKPPPFDAKAEFPLIGDSSMGPQAGGRAMAKLAKEFTMTVGGRPEARDYNLTSATPDELGFEAGAWISKADVVIVLEGDPWITQLRRTRAGTPTRS